MRVKSIPAFKKLAEQYLDHLGDKGVYYFLVHPQESERARLKELFLSDPLIAKVTEIRTYDRVETLFGDLEWLPLFSERTLFILEGSHKLKKEHLEHLLNKQRSFKGAALFILSELPASLQTSQTSASKMQASEPSLHALFDQKSLVLDLSEEKSWEKKKRIEEEIWEEVKRKKLHFEQNAIALFLEALSPEYLGWKEEVEKLSLYKGTEKKVTLSDLEALFTPIQEVQYLQGRAQEFLKSGLFETDASFEDPQRWLQWIGSLRSLLEGCIAFLSGGPLPKWRSSDAYETIVKSWPLPALERVWLELFEFERKLKLFQASPQLLWQEVIGKIDFLRYAP